MHDTLAAVTARLTAREQELQGLITAAEQDCEDIAAAGNERIAAIKAEAERKIDAIRDAMAAHEEEMTGIRHSKGTVEQLAAAVNPSPSEAAN